jgi:golgi phosphoprotein 3
MDTPDQNPEKPPKARPSKKMSSQPQVMLSLPEKLFILAIDDDQGAITASVKNKLRYGLAGAILSELAIMGKIVTEEGRIQVADPSPTGVSLSDNALALIAAIKKSHKMGRVVNDLAKEPLFKQTAERLAERNIITIEKKKYSWISPSVVYPQVDGSTKYWLKSKLRAIILAGEKPEAQDIALFSLLTACQLLRLVFTSDERSAAQKQVYALVLGDVYGEALAKLLSDIDHATGEATED